MSLHPEPIGEVPAETARVACAAFSKGTVVTRLRDEFSALYEDEDFRKLYPARGQPGLAPWRLALVTVFQFLEHLSDRQAADAVRARIDWKYALGLELTDPGLHFSVLTEFRARLVAGGAEHLLLDGMLERFKARGLVKARGKQRTDSTHVLAAVHDLHLLELVAETLRAALDDLAAAVPDWRRRVEDYRLPKSQEKREALALEVGADGFVLLDALDEADAPEAAREVAMVGTLRNVWRVHYAREGDGPPRWRTGSELPPVGERLQSLYDPEMHYSTKRQMEWSGYKVHVTKTCDEDAAHLVTHVMTGPAMQPDMAGTAEIHEHLAAKDLLPSEHFVDSSLRRCGAAGGQPARPRCLVRRAGPGYGEAADRGRTSLRAAPLQHRLGTRAGDLSAGQNVGDLACRSRRGRCPAHLRGVQSHRLRRLHRAGAVHAGKGRAPVGLLPPAPGI